MAAGYATHECTGCRGLVLPGAGRRSDRHQVLEAQPEVLEAMRSVSRARTVQRSIHLTPFGEDFCAVCLPLETAEMEALAGPEE
jgi:hypothetical protein